MKKLMPLLVLPILILVSCNTAPEADTDSCFNLPLAESTILDQEEYLILESILSEKFNNPDLVQISQESLSKSDSKLIAPSINSGRFQFDSTIVADYIKLNSSSFLWGELFTVKQDLRNNDELECYFTENIKNGWDSYYAKYKDSVGYLKFGRPVQNDRGEAILVYHHYCGIWCASGYVATLKKEDGEWSLTQNIMIWQS